MKRPDEYDDFEVTILGLFLFRMGRALMIGEWLAPYSTSCIVNKVKVNNTSVIIYSIDSTGMAYGIGYRPREYSFIIII